MQRNRGPSPQTVKVLRALAADPTEWRYGYDLGAEVALKSGSLYPILMRLEERGLLEASWEAAAPGKPSRHLYRLSTAGLGAVRALAAEPVTPPVVARRQLKGA